MKAMILNNDKINLAPEAINDIVVIDNDDVSLFLTSELFRFTGYKGSLKVFRDLNMASEYFDKDRSPSFVLIDYYQSACNDFVLLEKIFAQASTKNKSTRVIVMLDFLIYKDIIEARFPNCSFIQKPLHFELIEKVMKTHRLEA